MMIGHKLIKKYEQLSLTVKATMWFMLCSIIQKSISIITTPIFTRLMTTEQYGQYTVYNSWLQIFVLITTLRLNYGVFNKGMSKFGKNNRDSYTSSMQFLTTCITSVVLIIYLCFREKINSFTELSTFITLAMFAELYLSPAISFWTLRQRYDFKYRSVVLVTLGISITNAILGLIGVLSSDNKGIARILSCIMTQVCFGLALYIINIKRSKGRIIDFNYIKFAIIFNLPLIPHYLSTYILDQSDRIMIQKLVGIDQAAIYAVAYSAGIVMKIVTESINSALVPWQYRQLEKKNFNTIRHQLNSIILIIAPVLCAFIALAPEIMKVLAAPEYYEAIYVIPPVTVSVFYVFLFGLLGNIEFFYNANKFTMYLSMVGAFLNIILNFIFIKIFGYIAAAYTTMVCYLVFTVLHYIFVENLMVKNEKSHLFDGRVILGSCFLSVVIAVVFSMLYGHIMIRYIVIASIAIYMIVNLKKYIAVISELK